MLSATTVYVPLFSLLIVLGTSGGLDRTRASLGLYPLQQSLVIHMITAPISNFPSPRRSRIGFRLHRALQIVF